MAREFSLPRRILTGDGALRLAAPHLSRMGKNALLVTGNHVKTTSCFGELKALLEELEIAYTVFSDIPGEPDDKMVQAGLAAYLENQCDFFIAIGGGSPLDTMKAIAALVTNPGGIADYMGKVIPNPVPPMVAIPTTAGTGSEATQFTIITDSKKGIKMLLKGEVLVPELAIIEPAFTVSAPQSITASTGLDALTHAVESYTSRKAQPLTDAVAISAVKRIFTYLPAAYQDGTDRKAREEMSVAALEAGIAINNASVTLVHGMSRPIGALFHVPHGISNAMLLDKCLGFALDGAYERFADLGRAVGLAAPQDNDKTAAEKFLDGIRSLCKVCNVPSLAKYGIDKTAFFNAMDKMAQDALDSGSPSNTIKAVTKQDVLRIYTALWEG